MHDALWLRDLTIMGMLVWTLMQPNLNVLVRCHKLGQCYNSLYMKFTWFYHSATEDTLITSLIACSLVSGAMVAHLMTMWAYYCLTRLIHCCEMTIASSILITQQKCRRFKMALIYGVKNRWNGIPPTTLLAFVASQLALCLQRRIRTPQCAMNTESFRQPMHQKTLVLSKPDQLTSRKFN
jgi:hypothetical protein